MSDICSVIVGILVFAIPIEILIFLIRWIRCKSKKKLGIAIIISIVCFVVFTLIGALSWDSAKKPEPTVAYTESGVTKGETETVVTEPSGERQEEPVQSTDLLSQFKQLGFTDTEAQKIKEIFSVVGITKISNITNGSGTGIDNLQSFKCDIFDYHADKGGLSVHFTIENRKLCYIELHGIPTEKVDHFYITIFGNVKAKTVSSKKSVVLYDIWDENGEIIEGAVGYKAVFNFEEKEITSY